MENDTLPELRSSQNKQKIIRSFGRIKSRKISDSKNLLYKNFSEKYQINYEKIESNNNILEIGFGFGDFFFVNAKNNPSKNFYGCEPHINGIISLFQKLQNQPLNNIKITNEDVRLVINKFPDNFFEKIYILFPDPWPKQKHHKRRLINTEFLDEILAKKLKLNHKIIIASDDDSYKIWILAHILNSKKFAWTAKNADSWQNFPENWVISKYHQKALNENREPILIEIEKIHD